MSESVIKKIIQFSQALNRIDATIEVNDVNINADSTRLTVHNFNSKSVLVSFHNNGMINAANNDYYDAFDAAVVTAQNLWW